MTYSSIKKKGESIYHYMQGMTENDVLIITYGGKEYEIFCYHYKGLDSKDWSIYEKERYWSGMNIDRNGKKPTSMLAYTYDMMGNRTTYKFKIKDIEFVGLKSKKK